MIAHVLNPENVSHLQRANVNEIVMPDEHVPHLLAKHVTDPGVPQLFDELINQEEEVNKGGIFQFLQANLLSDTSN